MDWARDEVGVLHRQIWLCGHDGVVQPGAVPGVSLDLVKERPAESGVQVPATGQEAEPVSARRHMIEGGSSTEQRWGDTWRGEGVATAAAAA